MPPSVQIAVHWTKMLLCVLVICSRFKGVQNDFVFAVCDLTNCTINLWPGKNSKTMLVGCSKVCTPRHRACQSDNSSLGMWQQVWTAVNENSLHGCPERVHSCISVFCSLPVSCYCTGSSPFFHFPFLFYSLGLSRHRQSVTPWQIAFSGWKMMQQRLMGSWRLSFELCGHWKCESRLARPVQVQPKLGHARL